MFSKESEFFRYFWFKLISFMDVEPTDIDNRLHHSKTLKKQLNIVLNENEAIWFTCAPQEQIRCKLMLWTIPVF